MATSVQKTDLNCSEKVKLWCVGWTGGRGDQRALVREHCVSWATVQSRTDGRSRESPGGFHFAEAGVRMAPRFPAQLGGWLGVPFAEAEPQGGAVGEVTEERPCSPGEMLWKLTSPSF